MIFYYVLHSFASNTYLASIHFSLSRVTSLWKYQKNTKLSIFWYIQFWKVFLRFTLAPSPRPVGAVAQLRRRIPALSRHARMRSKSEAFLPLSGIHDRQWIPDKSLREWQPVGNLDSYDSQYGINEFKIPDVLKTPPISRHGNVWEITILFRVEDNLRSAVSRLQNLLYS